jgi:hypothetical protein
VQRTREGQKIMEQYVARQRLGGVDEDLSAKVKRMVLKPFMGQEGDEGQVGGGAEPVGGEEYLTAGRPLRVNLDLLSYSARVAMQQGNATLGESLYRQCTQMDPRDGRGWVGLYKYYKQRNQQGKARSMLVEGLKHR